MIVAANLPRPNAEKPRELIAPPQFIRHMTFGYSETMADILWIRAVQDLDQCGKGGVYHNPYKEVDKEGSRVLVPIQCDKGWLFRVLEAVVSLAPKFRTAYVQGGTALSVLVSDNEGAREIFEAGLKQFPTDWVLCYRAAYHFLIELKDQKRAAELLVVAGQNGAPQWVFALAGRLFQESGKLEFARGVLISAIEQYKDENEVYLNRMKERLTEIERQIASLKNSSVNSNSSTSP